MEIIVKFDIFKASQKLSELDLKIIYDNFFIEVLWFRVMLLRDGGIINRHTHSSYEFHFVKEGSCLVTLDDSEFIANTGEFYLTAPGIYHEQRNHGSENYIEYCINCDLTLTNGQDTEGMKILNILNNSMCKNVVDNFASIDMFGKALSEAFLKEIGYFNTIKCLVGMIIFSAARSISEGSDISYSVPLKSKKSNYRFRQIEKFIEDNISIPLTTKDIARNMFLSDKQVGRIVEECRGISTKELLIQMKLKKSKELIKESDLTIKEIAKTLGFSSEYYFSQFFKREEGYSPKQFRKNIKNV